MRIASHITRAAVMVIATSLFTLVAWAAPDSISSEAVIDAPAAEIWKAFTTKEGVESWMVARADIDLRIGGLMRTHYSKDGVLGDDGTIESMFLALDPGRMYSTRIARPPARFPFRNAWKSVWTVVYFDAIGVDKTRVTVRMLGYNDDEESQKMRDFFRRGNQFTLDALGTKFRKVDPAK